MAVFLLVLFAIVSALANVEELDLFEKFIKDYDRQYESQEEKATRFTYFQNSLARIKRLNANSKHAKFAINKFADLSVEEFQKRVLMTPQSPEVLATSCLANGVSSPQTYTDEEIAALPTEWDWRTTGGPNNKGIVTPVKNQGMCGSCWTFSVSGNLEGLYALKGHPLTSLSEQILVDCSHGCSNEPPYGTVCNQGCDGGWQWNAFLDVMTWGGLQTEAEYPYTAETGTCHMVKSELIAPIKNYTCFSGPKPASEPQLRAYIYNNGPVSIALNAGLLQFYFGGIVDPFFPNLECDPKSLDHALLIVGWGQERNWIGEMTPYWLVKNSWGTDWGDDGYFLIVRDLNMCGIANAVSTAVM
jgi:cathepsin F